LSVVSRKQSMVSFTPPSVEFSMGTMPYSACPRATSRKTSRTVDALRYSTERPNLLIAALCVKVPGGPR
jgi:hypothetical protein